MHNRTYMMMAGAVLVIATMLGSAAEHKGEDGKAGPLRKAAAPPLKGMTVAMLTGEGFQSQEALMPLAYLTNRGAEVTVIGIEPGEVKAYNSDITLLIEKAVTDVKPGDFDAMVLPGGYAPSVIRKNEDIVAFARKFYTSGKPVAAICHGPQVLITADVVEGKTMTCYQDVTDELKAAGATFEDKPVVRDENLVTSRNPDDIPAWLGAIGQMVMQACDKP